MEIFFLIAAFCFAVGFAIGWLLRRSWLRILAWCGFVSLVLGWLLFGLFGNDSQPVSMEYMLTAMIWFALPFIFFVLLPSLLGGMVAFFVRRETP